MTVSSENKPRSYLTKSNLSFALGFAMASIASLFAWHNYADLIDGPFFFAENFDKWFDADVFRTISTISNTETKGARSNLHPIFALTFYGFTTIMNAVLNDPVVVIQSLMSLNAFVATLLLWRLLNWLKLDLVDIFLCLSLFIASATFIFWFATIETFPIGATSMLLSLQIFTVRQSREIRILILNTLLCGASLAITISNWVVGLSAILLRFNFHKHVLDLFKSSTDDFRKKDKFALLYPIKVILLSGLVIAIIAIVQDSVFSSASIFLRVDHLTAEVVHTKFGNLQRFATRIIEIVVNPLVVGEIVSVSYSSVLTQSGWAFDKLYIGKFVPSDDAEILSINILRIVSMSHGIAVFAWLSLLVISVRNIYISKLANPIMLTSIIALGVFTALHSVYGFITFLYAPHFVIFYIILSSITFQSERKWIPRILIALLIIFGGYHNYVSVNVAKKMLLEISA